MSIAAQRRLLIAAAILAAVVAGHGIAEETYMIAAAFGFAGVAVLLWRITKLPLDALVAGLVVFGYLAGNRGFAQLHPPTIPLLPAEGILVLGIIFVAARSAMNRQLPLQVAPLDLALLIFLLIGTVRFAFDFPAYGFLAARDFAMVYYAAFFFLAKAWAEDERIRCWLWRCILVGMLASGPLWILSSTFPDFFYNQLTIWGAPLVYFKGDVGATLLAAAAVWMIASAAQGKWPGWVLGGALSAGVALCNSRAAILALAVAGAVAMLLRWWAFVRVQATLAAAGLVVLLLWGWASPRPFTDSRLYVLMENAASIADLEGTFTYRSASLRDKPDNNQFRIIWWQTVRDETLALNPAFGLGFGYNLADRFQRIYQPEADDDFAARSPHSYPVTVFARMGLIGALALAGLLIVMARETWRRGRFDTAQATPWLMMWTIFAGACFGVVLEGPMGAVVFWTLLGLANGSAAASNGPPGAEVAVQLEVSAARHAKAAPPGRLPATRDQIHRG